MSARSKPTKEDFYWLYKVKVLLFGGLTMSECLMTIMSAQCSYRVVNSLSLSLSLSLSPPWGMWGSMPAVFPLGWQVTRVPPYERRPFPSKENRQISERDDLGPPVEPGGPGDRFGIPKPSPQSGGTSHGAHRLQKTKGIEPHPGSPK
jgi:hypothetical protein